MAQHPATTAGTGEAGQRGTGQRQADLRRFRRDVDYYAAHRDELLARYPEMWVAIFDRQLVGVASDPRALVATLTERRIPAGQALVKHLTRENAPLVLPA
jgi:hypothetical protein